MIRIITAAVAACLFVIPAIAPMAIVATTGVLLSACAPGSQQAVTLEVAKAWVPSFAGAVVAAAGAYTGPNATEVQGLASQLQQAANDFANLGDVSTARSSVLSIISLAQQLLPLLKGPTGVSLIPANVAPYVPMALAVLQAFVSALPPPPSAPATPPAALAAQKAALVRR